MFKSAYLMLIARKKLVQFSPKQYLCFQTIFFQTKPSFLLWYKICKTSGLWRNFHPRSRKEGTMFIVVATPVVGVESDVPSMFRNKSVQHQACEHSKLHWIQFQNFNLNIAFGLSCWTSTTPTYFVCGGSVSYSILCLISFLPLLGDLLVRGYCW